MTEIKSCITCAHCHNPDAEVYFWCDKFRYETIDYVKGEVTEWRKLCEKLREPDGKCGPNAIGWEQRPPEEKPPEKKMSMWEVFRDFTKQMFGF